MAVLHKHIDQHQHTHTLGLKFNYQLHPYNMHTYMELKLHIKYVKSISWVFATFITTTSGAGVGVDTDDKDDKLLMKIY